MMGGATFDPEAKVEERAEMLAEAVEQGLITQEEADIFNEVHAAMDELMADGGVDVTGGMAARQAAMLAELVSSEKISQTQADAFNDIHDRLIEAGVMQ
jgi:predicted TIM-barrel enzyme